MVGVVIVSSKDSIRVTINIRHTSIVIIISIFSIIIRVIFGNWVIIKAFDYFSTAIILIFIVVIIITVVNNMSFRVIYSGSYTFTFD